MSNNYYTPPTDVAALTRARSGDINLRDDAVDAAFDKLPAEEKLKRGTVNYAVTTGAADAYIVALPYVPSGYVDGLLVNAYIHANNTGASTINVNSLGVKSIKLQDGGAPLAGDLQKFVDLRYSATTGFFHAQGNIAGSVAAAAASAAAASASASASSSSAASAAASYDNFDDRYLGPKASDPTLDNDGNALLTGALYFNTVATEIRVYTGTAWQPSVGANIASQLFSGTGAQTAFVLSSTPADENNTQVYVGGVYQQKNTYSLATATITFSEAPPVGTNNIEVITVLTLALNTITANSVTFTPTATITASNVQAAIEEVVSDLAASAGTGTIGTIRAGSGAVARTQESKNRDVVSMRDSSTTTVDGVTSNQADIVAAVADAYTRGVALEVPAGTYISTATIPNFHDVTIRGKGIIKRGSDLYYASPIEGQENILYASATGVITNDGLSASAPTTVQGAFNTLMAKGYLEGNWRVKLAAGTYTSGARIGRANETEVTPNTDSYKNNNVVSKNFIIIEGPDVGYDPATNSRPVPSALFDGASAAAIGIAAYFVKILVKNIKFSDYNGSSSSGGFIGEGCEVRTENVHTARCFYGISNFRGKLEVKGGSIYGSAAKQYTGIRSMFLNKHEIGSQAASAIGEGPLISFCDVGLLAQEGATGHSDAVQYEDCTDAIRVSVNARVNYDLSSFKRCNRAVRADFNTVIFGPSANYNIGTVDACDEMVVLQQGGRDVSRDAYANTGIATDYLTTPVTVTGTTSSTAILIKTLERGRYSPVLFTTRKPQHIRVQAFGTMSGVAGTKQFKMRLGGTLIGTITNDATDTGSWKIEATIVFFSATSQKGGISYLPHLSTNRVNYVNLTTVDQSSADTDYQFEVQLGNAADSITVEHCAFEVFG